MSKLKPFLGRAVTFLGLTGLGVGVYVWLTASGESPRARTKGERGQPVRVVVVNEVAAVPRVTGYGEVAASRSWQGVAEVGGTVIEMHADVQVGRIIREGTVLFEIDPEELELEKLRTVASAKGVRAQIAELETREQSTRASLAVEAKVLALAEKELERTQVLYRQGNAAQSEVETAEGAVLGAEKSVVALKNTLEELPAARRVLRAQLEEVNAGVTGAEIVLARTKIVAPFTMRLRELNVTTGQSVSSGQIVVVGEGLDVLEVTARLPIGGIDPLLPERPERPPPDPEPDAEPDSEPDSEPNSEPDAEPDPEPDSKPDSPSDPEPAPPPVARTGGGWFERIADAVTPVVRLRMAGVDATWPARFSRFAGVDPLSRTTGVVVELDRSQRRSGSNDVRLSSGMHVAVEFFGAPKPGCLAVPIEAVHDGVAYVVVDDDHLELRTLEIDWAQEDFVCVGSGLSPGDQVIISDVSPAVDGMRVVPTVDRFETERLAGLVGSSEDPS
ncbi:efflux RND transporter periplasmic adaptor subunit [Enhygromyxa salina]|uniref:Multidrug resistance protein MdtN n=1 Tax=Enhygromyxa salina TaxID=215803 RepID=A0A2S9YXA4_9BACT|nr:hypothetical protein [Enhygromyxa salina]PRQ09718.1 multidrug resistance protein MdtN [Enhygromyxa salina]